MAGQEPWPRNKRGFLLRGFVLIGFYCMSFFSHTCVSATEIMTKSWNAEKLFTLEKFASWILRSRASWTLIKFWSWIDLSKLSLERSITPCNHKKKYRSMYVYTISSSTLKIEMLKMNILATCISWLSPFKFDKNAYKFSFKKRKLGLCPIPFKEE